MRQTRHRGGLLDHPAGSRLRYSTRKSSAAASAVRGWSRQAACWPTPSLAPSPTPPSRCRQVPVSPSASIISFRPPPGSASRKDRHLLFHQPHQPTCRYIHRRFRPLSVTTEGTANFPFNEGTPLSEWVSGPPPISYPISPPSIMFQASARRVQVTRHAQNRCKCHTIPAAAVESERGNYTMALLKLAMVGNEYQNDGDLHLPHV